MEAFGPGGGLLVMLGMLAVGALGPVWWRERKSAKPDAQDPVKDVDLRVFMALHEARVTSLERRVSKLEDRKDD